MGLRNKLWDSLFCLLAGTLYAYALCRAVLSATILEADLGALLRVCIVMMLAWSVLLWGKWTLLVGLGGLALGGGIAFFLLYRGDFEAEWWLELTGLVGELSRFMQNQLPYRQAYSDILAVLLAFLLTLVTALNLRVQYGFYILLLLAAGCFAVPIYMEWGADEAALAMMALCLLVLLIKKLNLIARLRDRSGEKSNGAFALLFIPVCAAVFLAASAAPKPDVEAIREQGAPDVAGAADNLLYNLMPDQVFSWSDEGGRLGGPRRPDDTYVMEVAAQERLYLAGSVRDVYTGSSWEKSKSGAAPLAAADGEYDANAYGSLRESQRYFMNYYAWSIREVEIITGEARTKSIFSPPFVQRLAIGEVTPSMDGYGMLSADKPLAKEFSFTQSYIAYDYESYYFEYILREFAGQRAGAGLSDGELAPYLALPDSLPRRVGELAANITAGQGSDYDKLLAIKNYLARFPYILDPQAVPAGEDFVDYFLFEGQEGYCVYFASSMAVLGRCAGIPTRYVEGFILPEERNVNGNFTVTNKQAHAWMEAWFPGLGWVRFEATPAAGLGGQGEAPAEPQPLEEPEQSREESLPEEPEEPSQPEPSRPEESQSEPERPAVPPANGDAGGGDGGDKASGGPGLMIAAVVLLLLAAAGGVVLYLRRQAARSRRELSDIEELPNRDAVVAWFEKLLKAAGAAGYPIAPGETAMAWAGRVGDALTFESQSLELRDLAVTFCLAAYSGREVSDSDRRLMKSCYRELVLRLQGEQKSKLRYYLDRYLLGKY